MENDIAENKTPVKGYVYCVTCERDLEDNNFKIGCTYNSEQRLSIFNSNPANYRDTYYYVAIKEYNTIEEAYYMEKQVHKLLSAYRIRKDREWFHIENKDLLRIAFELKSDFSISLKPKGEHRYKRNCKSPEIAELRKKGLSIREISKELNMSKSTIGRIVKEIESNVELVNA